VAFSSGVFFDGAEGVKGRVLEDVDFHEDQFIVFSFKVNS
jgi:hypothetical protein